LNDNPRFNNKIKAPLVRLIGEDGQQLGVVKIEEALRLAYEKNLDLVEVAAKTDPPVCRVVDLGKFQYQREKQAKKAGQAHRVEIKGIRLSFNIAKHDLEMKARQAQKFLAKGDRVRIEIVLRGREKAFGPLARTKLQDFKSFIKIPVGLDQPITSQPRGFYMILSKGK